MLPPTKTLKLSFEKALKACGNESLIETLYSLQDSGAIRSFTIDVTIQVDRDRATTIENFFLLQEPSSTFPSKKKRTD